MSAITPLRFTGISTFSEDFQAILTRAVQIAALPIQQLQNQENRLVTRKQSVTALNANVESLTAAVRTLGEIGRTRSALRHDAGISFTAAARLRASRTSILVCCATLCMGTLGLRLRRYAE